MRIDITRRRSRELLAVGIYGRCSLGDRIEMLLKHRREFSPRVSPLRVGAIAVLLLICATAGSLAPRWIAFAQQPGAPLAFEVASIKADKSTDRPGLQVLPSGRLVVTNAPLTIVIGTAYDIPFKSDRLSGGPDWLRSDRFDIEATPPAGAFPAGTPEKVREQMVKQMLQTLLAERFKLVLRRETKELPVYAAIVGKNGPKLEKSTLAEKDCEAASGAREFGVSCHSFNGGRGRGAHGQAVDMSDLTAFVSGWTDRPVVDKTGIRGLFNIQTEGWLPMEAGPPPSQDARGENNKLLIDQPTIFEIFEKLGLKLEPQKSPLEVFVIEHVEKPDAN
jgi:uncharacterized protein (TIGR03435 family)